MHRTRVWIRLRNWRRKLIARECAIWATCCTHYAFPEPFIHCSIIHTRGESTSRVDPYFGRSDLQSHSLFQLVFVDHKFAGERCLRVWIPLHAAATVCQLQVEIGGRTSMAIVHVQSIQYIHRWHIRIHHHDADRPSISLLPWRHCIRHLFGKSQRCDLGHGSELISFLSICADQLQYQRWLYPVDKTRFDDGTDRIATIVESSDDTTQTTKETKKTKWSFFEWNSTMARQTPHSTHNKTR